MAARPKVSDIWDGERRPWGAIWRDHGRVARESLAFLGGRAGATLLAWLLIGIALALPAALYLVVRNLDDIATHWPGNAGFSVYFQPGVDGRGPAALARLLAGEADVERVDLITPEQALAEFRRRSGLADALDLLDDNPLPATLRVGAAPDVPTDRLVRLAERVAGGEGVDDVVLEEAWLERLAAIREIVRRVYWVMAVLLGVGAVLVSSASVRLAIEARLAELQVLALVGAGKRFMRRPFIYLGALYGVGGAVVAAMLVSAALAWLEAPLARLFGSYGQDLKLAGFDLIFICALLASGWVLGHLGARVATSQRLRDAGAP